MRQLKGETQTRPELAAFSVIAVAIVLGLISWFTTGDPALDAVRAHPMATPSIPDGGHVTFQRSETTKRAVETTDIFGAGTFTSTTAETRILGAEEEIPDIAARLRSQAQDLGYELADGARFNELAGAEIPEFPGISIVIAEHHDFVRVTVWADQDHFD